MNALGSMSVIAATAGWFLSCHVANAAGAREFTNHTDIGAPARRGDVQWNDATRTYTISGGGENMWFTNDSFHFVWKKISGDVTLRTDVALLGTGGNPHRKACLMIRQSLDAHSAYADVALHGDGLTSLQYRDAAGGLTHEIQANTPAPRRLGIEKRGDYVSMSLGGEDGVLRPAGASIRVTFQEPFYVGFAVCAHDANALERAAFANVELGSPGRTTTNQTLLSSLETVTISSTDRRVVYCTTNRIEAPNWARDGSSFFFNSKGRIFRLPVTGGEPQPIETGLATRCNNDHGISPDGTQLVISDHAEEKRSIIYTLPISGGALKRITALGPSYWHGWSPDGKTLAFCGERNGEFDIYTIPADGGAETRLTTSPGLDDGPDYSADGQFIYFNSERTGRMQVWRMRTDGTQPEQITFDEFNNWFPHPSPDGKWIVFLSYDQTVKGHPENKDVTLRLMNLADRKIRLLATLFGGQGTINVPSWSPDSRKLAFVSYHLQRSAR
jgi:TolB protein